MATIVTRAGKGSPLTNNEVDANFTNLNSAQLVAGGTGVTASYVSSVAVGGTTFAQPAVTGLIDSDQGDFDINYAGATGVTIANLSAANTYVYIDKDGALQQQITLPTREDWTRKIFTMRIAVENSVILGFVYLNNPIGHYANSIRDVYAYLLAQGIPFKKDQTVTGRAGDLGFDISAGSLLEFGGTGDIYDPNIKDFSAVSNAQFFLSTRTAFDAGGNTALPKVWDNNGTLTALGSTTLVGHRLYRFSNGNVCLQYGQGNYANMTLAKAGVVLEDYVLNPALANATFFGWWFIESTATNTGGTTLTDFAEYTIGVQGGSSGALSGCLLKGNNLSDLLDAAAARTNLGLGTGDSPTFAALTSTGEITANAGIALPDSQKATFGAGDDLQIYHDGGHSRIEEVGTGDLTIRASSTLFLQSATNENYLKGVAEGAVSVYYDNNAKLATTSSGIDVTGTISVASIGGLASVANDLTIFSTTSGHNGLRFHDNGILPTDNAGAIIDADADLGIETYRFKDLFLSGIASAGGIITPTAGTSNFVAGVNAGNSIVSGGNYNVVVGDEAGTAITTGDYNVAVGFAAGDATTTGSENISVGGYALSANTTGANNTAVGSGSLQSNTTASNNTSVGYGSLSANTTGRDNTAVGYSAAATNTTGVENVSMGMYALRFNTTGGSNTALGYLALHRNTTASNNTAVGRYALEANTTGGDNTATGHEALASNTTGTQNTAFGRASMDSNTEGDYNSSLGYTALQKNTTGDTNTGLGHGSLRYNTTGAGNTAVGTGSLGVNTTASQNTAVGRSALGANTTAADNTAVGYHALRFTTTGASNTAVGLFALRYNTTGHSNAAIGVSALTVNTTGSANVSVGMNSLKLNTTGSYNTSMGEGALLDNTTASNNTAVGQTAMRFNTTGSSCTAFGKDALYANTTAADNTAVGRNALKAATTGGLNTAVGSGAGAANTTGTHVTAVGWHAGSTSTGGGNTFLGSNAGTYVVATTSGTVNTIIGSHCRSTSATTDGAMMLGYDLSGAAGYTTLGQSGNDIRAAHGNVTWATVSDQRYKKDIVDSTAGLSFINALQPRTFKYKTLGELPETFSAYEADSTEVFKNSDTNHGFIAQEVKAAIDADDSLKDGFRLWDDRDDGSQEVAEAALIPILVKAIQELTARIETLEG